jgi:DNA-binding GntR family transcriptional regulator
MTHQPLRPNTEPPDGTAPLEPSATTYESLRHLILSGALQQGEQIIETQLAERLRVSRTPVRDALTRLVGEGLVDQRPNRTRHVADLWLKVRDVLAVRTRLEPWAAALASYNLSAADIDVLRGLQDRMEVLLENSSEHIEELLRLNRAFHERLTSYCNNPALIEVLVRLRPYSVFPRIIERYPPEILREAILEHRQIIDALWSRDQAVVERIVTIHLERGNVAIGEMLERREDDRA